MKARKARKEGNEAMKEGEKKINKRKEERTREEDRIEGWQRGS